MKTKITYLTDKGKYFRTIAPVSVEEADGYMHQHYNMNGILHWIARPTTKKKYKGFVNKLVKLTQEQSNKFFNAK